jgi:hypothetical protein
VDQSRLVSVEDVNRVVSEILIAQSVRLCHAAELIAQGKTLADTDDGEPASAESLVNPAETNIRVASVVLLRGEEIAATLL